MGAGLAAAASSESNEATDLLLARALVRLQLRRRRRRCRRIVGSRDICICIRIRTGRHGGRRKHEPRCVGRGRRRRRRRRRRRVIGEAIRDQCGYGFGREIERATDAQVSRAELQHNDLFIGFAQLRARELGGDAYGGAAARRQIKIVNMSLYMKSKNNGRENVFDGRRTHSLGGGRPTGDRAVSARPRLLLGALVAASGAVIVGAGWINTRKRLKKKKKEIASE